MQATSVEINNSNIIVTNNLFERKMPINLKKTLIILKRLLSLTLPFRDSERRQLQLWKVENLGLIGSIVDAKGQITLVSTDLPHKIRLSSPKYRVKECL